jgi:hypothetical protein
MNCLNPGSYPGGSGLNVGEEEEHPPPNPPPLTVHRTTGNEDRAAVKLAHARATPTYLRCSTAENNKSQSEAIVLTN